MERNIERIVNDDGEYIKIIPRHTVEELADAQHQYMDALQRKEWQRWIPLLGVYRLIKDGWNGDDKKLKTVHGAAYDLAVIVYNLVQIEALIGFPIIVALARYFENMHK